MKPISQIKGNAGLLKVSLLVEEKWKSDFNQVPQENDDGIDGIILIRKKGELTGEVIYTQIKAGSGYKKETKVRDGYIDINVGSEYILRHRPRWKLLPGAVILIFVDDDNKMYWTNLKSDNSYSDKNKSIILVKKSDRFGTHSKGHFKKISGIFPEDRLLKTLILKPNEIKILHINHPLKKPQENSIKIGVKVQYIIEHINS